MAGALCLCQQELYSIHYNAKSFYFEITWGNWISFRFSYVLFLGLYLVIVHLLLFVLVMIKCVISWKIHT